MLDPFTILLVDDFSLDVELIRAALSRCKHKPGLRVSPDGESALAYLHKQPPHASAATPDLVLLDLHLPGRDGFAVLQEIKNDPGLAHIPVIMLTSSEDDGDVERAYDLQVNGYIVKPVIARQFMESICSITEFWMKTARLPSRVGR
jgi:chemotaxis family two-component system response regulator Rcp1